MQVQSANQCHRALGVGGVSHGIFKQMTYPTTSSKGLNWQGRCPNAARHFNHCVDRRTGLPGPQDQQTIPRTRNVLISNEGDHLHYQSQFPHCTP